MLLLALEHLAVLRPCADSCLSAYSQVERPLKNCLSFADALRVTEFKDALVEEAGTHGKMYAFGYAFYLAAIASGLSMITLALVLDMDTRPKRRHGGGGLQGEFGSYQQDDMEVRPSKDAESCRIANDYDTSLLVPFALQLGNPNYKQVAMTSMPAMSVRPF